MTHSKTFASPRILLLGTGTDVGKTYVGVALTRALRSKGWDVLALKPVESGLGVQTPASLPSSGDAVDLARVASRGAPPRFALRDPISPHLAARREGLEITTAELRRWVGEQEQAFLADSPACPVTLIETAGGCFSPLGEMSTNFDLARALEPAHWVLVAPDRLGVLHDVQATLRAMAGRPPDVVLLSQAYPDDASTGSNEAELQRVVLPQLSALLQVPHITSLARGEPATQLCDILLGFLDKG